MPSGNTKNPIPASVDSLRTGKLSRRRLLTLVAAGGVLSGLTACAEGTARNAKRGKADDMKRTSVVEGVQATESARFLTAGTATPQASETPKD